MMDPNLNLAFSVQKNPGCYALLLGAGVSMSSGVPSAWGVQDALIKQLAAADQQDCGDDSFGWYEAKFGASPTYEGLLESLAATQSERQSLLRNFFEPTSEQREAGEKMPSPAHRAIARLVQAGRVRVLLTLNFDTLLETALRDAGIEPTVVSQPSDIDGLNPLHSQQALIIHLHGDYLTPSAMLNTVGELESYQERVDRLLDRILSDYGLIIAGWSAKYDPALVSAMKRTPNPHYSTFWADPQTLGEIAHSTLTHRQGHYVEATADDFFGKLADACESLSDIDARHPLTVPIAVANAKRDLRGGRLAIPLHDQLKSEIDSVWNAAVGEGPAYVGENAAQEASVRIALAEETTRVLSALIATCAYWGEDHHDRWWLEEIGRFGNREPASFATATATLRFFPAAAIFYAGGVAAVAAGRFDVVHRVLDQRLVDGVGEVRDAAEMLAADQVIAVTQSSNQFHAYLESFMTVDLGIGKLAYDDAWEYFEYLRLLHLAHIRMVDREPELLAELVAAVGRENGMNEVLQHARSADSQGLDFRLSRIVPAGLPHVRVRGIITHVVQPLVSQRLESELERRGPGHPAVMVGFAGGSVESMRAVMAVVDSALVRFVWWRWQERQTSGSGVQRVPDGTFWIDDI